MNYEEIKAAWNAQADEHNQWDTLSDIEKIGWAALNAAEMERASRVQACNKKRNQVMTHTNTQQPEALNLEEFRAKVTRAAREPLLVRIAELEEINTQLDEINTQLLVRIAELEEINTQLCEQADAAAGAYADLQAQLVKEAARTAEEKLRADQMSKQHDMQAKMHLLSCRKASFQTF